jgi:hypothetical protein
MIEACDLCSSLCGEDCIEECDRCGRLVCVDCAEKSGELWAMRGWCPRCVEWFVECEEDRLASLALDRRNDD